MYENMTYENILSDMLSRVTSDVDKREGSVIYDALGPCAYQLAQAYFMLHNFIDLVSGDTAVGEYLDRIVISQGMKRKAATYAVRKIRTTGAVEIDTRWALNDTVYTITELLTNNIYVATCEQLGEIGNHYFGELENIDNVNGITAIMTDIITSGQDEETDDNLRARYYEFMRRPSTSGNADNYKQWALELTGIGDAKTLSLWDGPGTVKVVIVDSDKEPVTEQLISTVFEHIEQVRPIGALVTVVSALAKNVSITVKVSLANGYTIQGVQNTFVNSLEKYRKEIAFKDSYISYAALGNILFSVEGITDYTDLKLNGAMQNVVLDNEEIPIFNIVELEVM